MPYLDIVYGQREQTPYPNKLAELLRTKYFGKLGKVLDVGCGDGTFTRALQKEGFKAIGIDRKTMHNGRDIKLDFNKDHFPFDDNTFDFVFCKSVIEHVENTEFFLSEIKRVLTKDGIAVIMVPSFEYVWKDFYHDHTHVKPLHLRGLRDACRIVGFSKVEMEYFYQLPIIWKYPVMKIFSCLTRWFVPDIMKFKDNLQVHHRPWIRFSKELMTLAKVTK